jgi:uncharacterized Fe-S cluster protein YjdI
MEANMSVHRYDADGFTVTYDPDVCIHAGRCVKGLPGVFDSKRTPWIDPTQATADEVEAQIRKCPSGALGFERDDS